MDTRLNRNSLALAGLLSQEYGSRAHERHIPRLAIADVTRLTPYSVPMLNGALRTIRLLGRDVALERMRNALSNGNAIVSVYRDEIARRNATREQASRVSRATQAALDSQRAERMRETLRAEQARVDAQRATIRTSTFTHVAPPVVAAPVAPVVTFDAVDNAASPLVAAIVAGLDPALMLTATNVETRAAIREFLSSALDLIDEETMPVAGAAQITEDSER